MGTGFQFDVFLSHSSKDKAVVRCSSLSASIEERARERSRKYYFDSDQVEIAAELVHELDADGKQLRVVKLTDYTVPRSREANRYATVLDALTELTKEPAQACSKCGANNPLTSRFCSQCGQPLAQAEPAQTPATKSSPQAPSAEELNTQGFRLTQEGLWEDAIEKYREAIAADSKHGLAYTNLGFALNRTGQFEQAIEVLTKASKLTGEDVHLAKIFDLRGFSNLNLKDYEQAVADFTESLSFNSRDPKVYVHRAQARAELGDYPKALQDVDKALKLDPENHHAVRLRRKLRDEGAI
jgi:tetratricopeptide (TPR) repeat protein